MSKLEPRRDPPSRSLEPRRDPPSRSLEPRRDPPSRSLEPRRRPRRAGERGAAMVEGLAAIPFFLLIFAAGVYIQNLYSAKLESMAKSRAQNWQNAQGACNTGAAVEINIFGFSLKIPAPNNADLAAGQASPGGQLCSAEFDSSSQQVSDTVPMSSFLGGGSAEVKSNYRMLCDEQPVPGDFEKGIDYLWDKYGPPPEP